MPVCLRFELFYGKLYKTKLILTVADFLDSLKRDIGDVSLQTVNRT